MNTQTPTEPAPVSRFEQAIKMFDDANSQDPNTATEGQQTWPRELLYALRLHTWVLKLRPEASEALRLAARCQHICRWEIPRDRYPMTRAGYLQWRSDLKQFHARRTRAILAGIGYPEEILARVEALNLKQNLRSDPECQVLEDALCLVFLEHQLADLAPRSTEEKLINALRKSWAKMSPPARAIARGLPLEPAAKALLDKALAGPHPGPGSKVKS